MSDSIFNLFNMAGLAGWSIILLACLSLSIGDPAFLDFVPFVQPTFHGLSGRFFDVQHDGRLPIIDKLLLLELICLTEVARIALGQLRGNLILGTVLHAIRLTCLLLVLPGGLARLDSDPGFYGGEHEMCMTVLYSWSLTEVGRYPMYLFPESGAARNVRLLLPLVTFPVGAAAEALGAYSVMTGLMDLGEKDMVHWAKICALGMVLFVNGVLGPTMAYPALLKKGLPILTGKAGKKKEQ